MAVGDAKQIWKLGRARLGQATWRGRQRPGLAVEMICVWTLCDASGGGLWRPRLAGRQGALSGADNGKVGGSSDGGPWKKGAKGRRCCGGNCD